MAKTSGIKATNNTSPWKIIIGIVLALSLAANGFLLWRYTELESDLAQAEQTIELFKADPESAQQASVAEYVEQVSRVYDLPEDETPSVATVRDKDMLDDQPFFARAENGDVVLIYPEAELAILYRPSSGQLINVSSLTIDDESEALEIQEQDADSSGPNAEE